VGFLDFFKSDRSEPGVLPAIKNDYASNRVPKVITVWSSKGGVGKTTIAVNLAAYLQATGRRVCVVDVDEFGDTGYMAARQEKYEEQGGGVVPSPERLWAQMEHIRTFEELAPFLLLSASTGCYFLPSPEENDPALRLTAKAYDRITVLLQKYFDVLVYDCGPSFHQDTIRYAILKADCLVAVFNQNNAMLRNFASMVQELAKQSSGVGKEKMVLLLNTYKPLPGVMTDKQGIETFKNFAHAVLVMPDDKLAGQQAVAAGELLLLTTRSQPLKDGFRDLLQTVLDVLYARGN